MRVRGRRQRTTVRLVGWTTLVAVAVSACGAKEPDPLLQELGVIGEADSSGHDDGSFVLVLERLEAGYAAAIAARLRDGAVTDEAEDAIRSSFDAAFADRILGTLATLDTDELSVFRGPGVLAARRHTRVVVLERTDACVHLESRVDATPLVVDGTTTTEFIVLTPPPRPDDRDGDGRHPGWVIAAVHTGDPAQLRSVEHC